jgi:8-oxo-dGTP pyrophosphatase MutT (NUDIX family)
LEEDKKTICKVVILCGTRVLVLKRSRWVIYHPKRWDVPGGAVDSGESLEHAAARECLEEAGFVIDPTKLKLVDSQSKMRDGKPAERFCFSYFVDEEFEPKLSFEHSKYAWMDIRELDNKDLPNFYKDCAKTAIEKVIV